MAITKIYLVRHGETAENRAEIMQGQLDTLLNEAGVEQAERIGEALKSIPFEIAYSSDLSRATETTERILAHHPGVGLHRQASLRERFMGQLQGKHVKLARLPSLWDDSIESKEDFTSRVMAWWDETLHHLASLPPGDAPRHVLVTSHGGFIGTLVRTLTESGKAVCAKGVRLWRCHNSSVSIIDVQEDGKGVVVQFGDVSHLFTKPLASNADTAVDSG